MKQQQKTTWIDLIISLEKWFVIEETQVNYMHKKKKLTFHSNRRKFLLDVIAIETMIYDMHF